jgi:hypothetical protein
LSSSRQLVALMLIRLFAGLATAALFFASNPVWASGVTLVMVEQPGCHYCRKWDEEIGPIYPKTSEGQFAPLIRAQLGTPPEGTTYARRVNYTPTFIVVQDGQELTRLEGYPGEDFFWPVLEELLKRHAGYEPVTQ